MLGLFEPVLECTSISLCFLPCPRTCFSQTTNLFHAAYRKERCQWGAANPGRKVTLTVAASLIDNMLTSWTKTELIRDAFRKIGLSEKGIDLSVIDRSKLPGEIPANRPILPAAPALLDDVGIRELVPTPPRGRGEASPEFAKRCAAISREKAARLLQSEKAVNQHVHTIAEGIFRRVAPGGAKRHLDMGGRPSGAAVRDGEDSDEGDADGPAQPLPIQATEPLRKRAPHSGTINTHRVGGRLLPGCELIADWVQLMPPLLPCGKLRGAMRPPTPRRTRAELLTRPRT